MPKYVTSIYLIQQSPNGRATWQRKKQTGSNRTRVSWREIVSTFQLLYIRKGSGTWDSRRRRARDKMAKEKSCRQCAHKSRLCPQKPFKNSMLSGVPCRRRKKGMKARRPDRRELIRQNGPVACILLPSWHPQLPRAAVRPGNQLITIFVDVTITAKLLGQMREPHAIFNRNSLLADLQLAWHFCICHTKPDKKWTGMNFSFLNNLLARCSYDSQPFLLCNLLRWIYMYIHCRYFTMNSTYSKGRFSYLNNLRITCGYETMTMSHAS